MRRDVFALTATDLGAAYGTAKSGVGISSMGVMNPQLVMRNIVPVVMAGVLGIYGLIVAVVLIQQGNVFLRRRCIVAAADCVTFQSPVARTSTPLTTAMLTLPLVCLVV